MADNVNQRSGSDPRQTQRNPELPYNQLRPKSLASSGAELDEGCEISQAEAGSTETYGSDALKEVNKLYKKE
jgi:hypothetical protein